MDIRARMPGQIVELKVGAGDFVKKNSIVALTEGLKLEQRILCPVDGTVSEVKVNVGDKVKSGQVIMVIDLP